jgi:ADP-ribose pyrophosphatase YjhB (NUDIX family)
MALNHKPPAHQLSFLDELRSIAQIGLHYATDPYDRERYERLLELSAIRYSELSGLPPETILERFRAETGHVTPKVGLDGAVFNDEGKILLVRRSDDLRWCLPCGFPEAGETPREGIEREIREETGLETVAEEVIDVDTRLAGEYGAPHTLYIPVFLCRVTGGTLATSDETPEVGFFDPSEITEWHRDHEARALKATAYWRALQEKR